MLIYTSGLSMSTVYQKDTINRINDAPIYFCTEQVQVQHTTMQNNGIDAQDGYR
jgi:hypothetical protein